MLARPRHILRWLGHLLSAPNAERPTTVAPARLTVHSFAVERQDRGGPRPGVVDPVIGRDRVERARVAWLRAMEAYVHAGRKHAAAATLHARLGHPEPAARALERASAVHDGYKAALDRHPEWAADASAWLEPGTNTPPG